MQSNGGCLKANTDGKFVSESTCHLGAWMLLTKPEAYANESAQVGEALEKGGPARPQRILCAMLGSLG